MGQKYNPFNPPQKRDEDKPAVTIAGQCAICGEDILRPYIRQSDDEVEYVPPIPDRGHHVEDAGTTEQRMFHADCWHSRKGQRARKVAA